MNVFLAVDLGTTSILASLLNEATGKRIAVRMALNPQRQFGLDVVTRVAAAAASVAVRKEMACTVSREIEALAASMLEDAGLHFDSLKMVAIAGNPAMEHLLLDLPVDSLARLPYRPLFTGGKKLSTTDVGWGWKADLFVFPLPGGFVGGDLVAFLYDQGFGQISAAKYPCLFLDMGTNAEIALHVGQTLYATSAAAGPAFEGGNLSCGMPVLPGAITALRIDNGKVVTATLDGASPLGLCGTGALTTISALLVENVIDASGMLLEQSMIPSNLANRIKVSNGTRSFVIYRDATREIILTQEDIRQVQFAKAAIRAGIEVLCDRAGITGDDLAEIVISGAFGVSLLDDCLRTLGMIPGTAHCTVRFVENGVLGGVEKYLLGHSGGAEADAISSVLKVVPLSGSPLFERLYLSHMNFQARKDSAI